MTTTLRIMVVLLVLGTGAPSSVAAGQSPAPVPVSAVSLHTALSDGVMLVMTPDSSGSMAKTVQALGKAEIEQIRRSLRAGDLYVRIPFNATARVAVLQQIHEPGDLDLIAGVVSQNSVAAGRTALSSGLIAAKEMVERYRGNRRVVLVVPTDAINDPADGVAAEEKRLAAITAWWRVAPDSQRIVVGVEGRTNGPTLKAFAHSLDAKLVTAASFAEQSVVERAVVAARPPAPPTTPRPQAPLKKGTDWRPWALGVATLALLGFVVSRWRARDEGLEAPPIPMEIPLALPALPAAAVELVVRVASNGRVHEQVLDVTSLEDGVATLGASGSVEVPGLSGCPISIEVVGDGLSISVSSGQGIRIDGEPADALPQPMHVGREARLAARGASITVQLRRAGSRRQAKHLQVVGFGRNR